MNQRLVEVPAKFQRAVALHEGGQFAEAKSIYEEILEVQPRHGEALHLLGLIAAQSHDPKRAAELIAKAVEIEPNNAMAHCNRASALFQLKRFDAALASYDRAIAVQPDFAGAHFNRGVVLHELKRFNAALASYDQAIAIQPLFAEAFFRRGDLLQEQGQLDAALASFTRAVELRPGYADAWFNRGNVLAELAQWQSALESYDQAIANKADFALAYANRGNVLKEFNQLADALRSYDRAIALQPDYAPAHANRAVTALLAGDFARGWLEFEWRWKTRPDSDDAVKNSKVKPLWLGKEAIAGKTILLRSEQGLGDTLQFCRYAPMFAKLGAKVVLEAQKQLVTLLDGLEGVSQLVVKGGELPEFDYQCPLLSLPLAFQTTLETIPWSGAYLKSHDAKVSHWRARLGPKTRPRIGLAWSGSTLHKYDNRSISLAEVMRYLPPAFQYISLQTEVRPHDLATLQSKPEILHFADELDFINTAALCECLDLTIAIDTSIAHLSGALGKKTWILLPFNPDWRWLLHRTDSPWYPSASLYRQDRIGDWAGVLRRVAADLHQVSMTH